MLYKFDQSHNHKHKIRNYIEPYAEITCTSSLLAIVPSKHIKRVKPHDSGKTRKGRLNTIRKP